MAEDGPERRASLSQVLDALDDGALAVDETGAVTAVNDGAVAALAPERERADLHGEPAAVLLDGVDLPGPGETVELAGAEERRTFEARVSAADGVAGAVDRVVVLRDVTDRVREVRRLRALTSVLRHAMRDEMTGVMGRAQYVRDAIEEAAVLSEARRAADAVVEATSELADLGQTAWAVEDVFGDGGPERERLDIVPVVEAAVDDVADEYSDVKVALDLPDEAPAVAAGALESALAGVVEDACERNDAPVPRVDVAVECDGEAVTVDVADNGSGIPEASRRTLETGEGTPLETGGDLDLWLAHWVVDAAGGEITVGENVPRGSVVSVELPAAD